MHVDVRQNREAGYGIVISTPDGEKIGTAYAFDTDEKWFEEYVVGANGKIVVVGFNTPQAALLTRRVEQAQFDVVDRNTGEVLVEVR